MFLAEELEVEEVQGIDIFLPEIPELIWASITLIIIAVFFYFFVMPKFMKVLDERKVLIEDKIENAEKLEKEAQKSVELIDKKLADSKKLAADILMEAQERSDKIIEDSKLQASKEYSLKIAQANKQIEDEARLIEIKLKANLGQIALNMSEKILQEKLQDQKVQSKKIDEFIDSIE